jgi:hypothetical protein
VNRGHNDEFSIGVALDAEGIVFGGEAREGVVRQRLLEAETDGELGLGEREVHGESLRLRRGDGCS